MAAGYNPYREFAKPLCVSAGISILIVYLQISKHLILIMHIKV